MFLQFHGVRLTLKSAAEDLHNPTEGETQKTEKAAYRSGVIMINLQINTNSHRSFGQRALWTVQLLYLWIIHHTEFSEWLEGKLCCSYPRFVGPDPLWFSRGKEETKEAVIIPTIPSGLKGFSHGSKRIASRLVPVILLEEETIWWPAGSDSKPPGQSTKITEECSHPALTAGAYSGSRRLWWALCYLASLLSPTTFLFGM